jgi:hypothetical protein
VATSKGEAAAVRRDFDRLEAKMARIEALLAELKALLEARGIVAS